MKQARTSSKSRSVRAFVARLNESLERVVEHPPLFLQAWHLAKMFYLGVRRAQIPRMAAALSYRTIFGLIPVLVVSFVLVTAFSSEQTVRNAVHSLLDFAGLTRIELTPGPEAVPGDPSPHAVQTIRLDEWIQKIVANVKNVPGGAASIIGLLTLVYAALSMLVDIEQSFNQVYMAPTGRSWVRRGVNYWALLTLGTVGLVATFVAQQSIFSAVKEHEFAGGLTPLLLKVAGFIAPLLISTVLLIVVYVAIPNTRVQMGPAAAGAFLAAVLWETGKLGLRTYVQHSVGYSTLYGPIALLPLFLIWVYATWIIVLGGLQVAHTLQSYSTAKHAGLTRSVLETLGVIAQAATARRTLIMDPAAILVVMIAAAQRFREGKSSEHSQIADKTGIDERVVSEMLERLAKAGFMHRVAGGQLEGAYVLSRPPESIAAADVLLAGEDLSAVDRGRAPRLLGELSATRLASLKGKVIADMIPPPAAPAPAAPVPIIQPSKA